MRQALYTDPDDHSVWLYHAWLVDLDVSAAATEAHTGALASQGSSPRAALLQREINSIEELLEVEPDSRYCLEALARYKASLAEALAGSENEAGRGVQQPASAGGGTTEQVAELRKDVAQLLTRLVDVDPDRAGRYRDLVHKAGVAV